MLVACDKVNELKRLLANNVQLAQLYEASKTKIVKFYRSCKLRAALQRACHLRKDIYFDFNMVRKSCAELNEFT